MPVVNQVQKKIHMDQWNIVKFQLAVHCHINNVIVSDLDLSCLTLLALTGEKTLGEFCDEAAAHKIFGSEQSVRNAVTKAEKNHLILKKGTNKKKISINIPNIETKGNILLDYKVLRVEPPIE
jgi:hypothetical protein